MTLGNALQSSMLNGAKADMYAAQIQQIDQVLMQKEQNGGGIDNYGSAFGDGFAYGQYGDSAEFSSSGTNPYYSMDETALKEEKKRLEVLYKAALELEKKDQERTETEISRTFGSGS